MVCDVFSRCYSSDDISDEATVLYGTRMRTKFAKSICQLKSNLIYIFDFIIEFIIKIAIEFSIDSIISIQLVAGRIDFAI